jgi:hypothetical protein
MRRYLICFCILIALSCDEDENDFAKLEEVVRRNQKGQAEAVVEEPCVLSKDNAVTGIKTLRHWAPYDTLTVLVNGKSHQLLSGGYSIFWKFPDSGMRKRITYFSAGFLSKTTAKVVFYYPADSSSFNNREYLKRYMIGDFNKVDDRQSDSLALYQKCPFRFYMEFNDGVDNFKTVISDQTEYFELDSIKHVYQGVSSFSFYKAYGKYSTRMKTASSGLHTPVSGILKLNFETAKQ